MVEDGEDRVKELLNNLTDRKSQVSRLASAIALGKFGDERAVEPLIETMKYGDTELQKYSIRSLGQIGTFRCS